MFPGAPAHPVTCSFVTILEQLVRCKRACYWCLSTQQNEALKGGGSFDDRWRNEKWKPWHCCERTVFDVKNWLFWGANWSCSVQVYNLQGFAKQSRLTLTPVRLGTMCVGSLSTGAPAAEGACGAPAAGHHPRDSLTEPD